MSGYRDDFYVPENIIGYTGELGKSATVYFEKQEGDTITFGRITQDHLNKENEGREMVRVRPKNNYEGENIRAAQVGGKNVSRKDYLEENKGKIKLIGPDKYQNIKTGEEVTFKKVYVEKYDHGIPHISRTALKKTTPVNIETLREAIGDFTDKKLIHTEEDIRKENEIQELIGKSFEDLFEDEDEKQEQDRVEGTSKNQAGDVDNIPEKVNYVRFAEQPQRVNAPNRQRRNTPVNNNAQEKSTKPRL